MPRFAARAEFRRRDRGAPWVLAGVIVEGSFWPAVEGAEPIRRRLPEAGLVGWTDLPSPILAANEVAAATIALGLARTTWPRRVRPDVPFVAGPPDRRDRR